jgi:Rps23 Pro-64 3,4-dihydroxylase Tpa1-like proline 4-hydroxylase
MNYLNLDALNHALKLEQFDGYLLNNLLHENKHEVLNKAFPQNNFERIGTDIVQNTGYAAQVSYQFEYIYLDNFATLETNPHLDPVWFALFSELASANYNKHLSKLVQMNLSNKKIAFEFIRYQPGDYISKHYDKQPNKVLVQLFYFNHFWDIRWGGNFKMLSSHDHTEIISLPPLIHSSVILKATPQAWHEVTPVVADAKDLRIALQVEWFQAENM